MNELNDVLKRLSNEIDNLRTILHSGYDIGRAVDSGACSAPTTKANAGDELVYDEDAGPSVAWGSPFVFLGDEKMRARIIKSSAAVLRADRESK